MAYPDFSLDSLRKMFDLVLTQAALFPEIPPLPMSPWLRETLDKGMPLALGSEKARSEFILVPILLTSRELSQYRIAIYSGQRMDSDPSRGLVGECDFILALTPQMPIIQAPIVCIVEAKKNDIESGLGQCAAQMVGAQVLNAQEGNSIDVIFGCVTTGEAWQFLKLEQTILTIDRDRYYINDVGTILAVFQAIIATYAPATATESGG